MRLTLITIVVDNYDRAIEFFTGILGFDLVEDSPSLTNDGRPKRWVVVRPPGAETGILLARRTGRIRPPLLVIRLPGGSGSSCGSVTSTPPTRA